MLEELKTERERKEEIEKKRVISRVIVRSLETSRRKIFLQD